jgi:hypothetical protein
MNWTKCVFAAAIGSCLAACQGDPSRAGATPPAGTDSPIDKKLAQYTIVRLTADLGRRSENEREIIAHGLGIKNTINRKGTVREALKEQAGRPSPVIQPQADTG